MFTIIKSSQKIICSEIMLWVIVICIVLAGSTFIAFRSNRNKKRIISYLISLFVIFEICDFVWLSYLFPGGEYFNRGLGGIMSILILPLSLVVLNISLTASNKS
jgi:hypothetical protein